MYAHLTGLLVKASQSPVKGAVAVLDINGVGYLVHTTPATLARVQSRLNSTEPVTLHTHLVVQETLLDLVGFATVEERDLFVLLLQASGVGVRVALALLTDLSVAEIVQAVISKNHKPLTAAKGVGPKLAQKLVLELHEKMTTYQETVGISTLDSDLAPLPTLPALEEAQAVLYSLGYAANEIAASVSDAHRALGDTATAEAILQRALQWLAQKV